MLCLTSFVMIIIYFVSFCLFSYVFFLFFPQILLGMFFKVSMFLPVDNLQQEKQQPTSVF